MQTPFLRLALVAISLFAGAVAAQEKTPIKFGKITPSDFDVSQHKFDTSADAVVIADVGLTVFEGNNKGWFSLVHKRQKRIKILNKNGFGAANVMIPLYFDGSDEEKLDNLKAITYNLENGKVVETKLENDAIFKDKLSKKVIVKKFTFPAVKENSIIEMTYTTKSDFIRSLQPWTFQDEHPTLWSEYQVEIPSFFNYVVMAQGYQAFHIKETKNVFRNFNVLVPGETAGARNETYSFSGDVHVTRWVMKDVPVLKEENFTSTINNHVAKLQFQLSELREPLKPKKILGNWITAADELMKSESFGATLAKNNNWLDDEMKVITAGASTPLQKARQVYAYVRDHFTCTNHYGFFLTETLKSAWKAKNGSVADINLLLTAMLLHQGIQADPIILSTRDHGVTHEFYPLMDQYNYVIASAEIDGRTYFLDASRPELGFGRLPNTCYNGCGRVISTTPEIACFVTDSLVEKKVTSIVMINDEKDGIKGSMHSMLGYFESIGVREKLNTKGEDDFFNQLKSAYSMEMDITEHHVDSAKVLEQPLTLHYDFSTKMEEDIIYLNPLFAEAYKENVFKAAERFYPVEMPYAFDETFILNMEVPKGYAVEELPKSARVSFNDGEGKFEYLIGHSGDRIQLRSRVVIGKATFQPDEYQSLRDFYGYIVKKHEEQIVLKKKKS